jgi:hypothetical protein
MSITIQRIRIGVIVAFAALLLSVSFAQEKRRIWKPTSVPAGTVFVGHQVCAECHEERVKGQQQSAMGMAMEPVGEARILSAHSRLLFRLGR